MSYEKRLTRLYDSAPRIPIDDSSRIVLASDCHRGDAGWSDNFARNQTLYFHALSHYYASGFTYIELGDGDELWENRRLSQIVEAHSNVYWLLSKFHAEGRLYLLYGNHDMIKKYPNCQLGAYFDARERCTLPLCPGARFYEALVLQHTESGREILLVHGHQADFLNCELWKLTRFLVRYLWRPLEVLGVNDPTAAAKNYKRRRKTEKKLIRWVKGHPPILVAGHTHRPVFPMEGEARYYNDGSCVHPRCITCIEISNGRMMLVKWTHMTRPDGTVYVGRELLEPPRSIWRA